ncbi:hypothetical protein AF72_08080 [Xylella taiwanensis]|uniref:Uncharacterized protein n=1 Tax=Xylella taiwanensis TaxID=1444770 RepID=Z9JJM4_9GAMM|nr:hypothetical protein AF72_08080 [Xylella taiwanensis]
MKTGVAVGAAAELPYRWLLQRLMILYSLSRLTE